MSMTIVMGKLVRDVFLKEQEAVRCLDAGAVANDWCVALFKGFLQVVALVAGRPQFPFFVGGFLPQPFFNPFFGGFGAGGFPGFGAFGGAGGFGSGTGAFSGAGGFDSGTGGFVSTGDSGSSLSDSTFSSNVGGGSFHSCHNNCVGGICSQVCRICSNGKCTDITNGGTATAPGSPEA